MVFSSEYSTRKPSFTNGILNIDYSHFLPNLILMVSETCIYFFNENYDDPIFTSPYLRNSKFTCGKFSISRPRKGGVQICEHLSF